MADDDFKHDLIIATEDGDVFHLTYEQWHKEGKDGYKVNPREYEYDEGVPPETSWEVLRDLLRCGANVAVVPPVLPPRHDGTHRPRPTGTCYVLNLAGFKRSNPFHVKAK
jgi:hypothetical protein